MANGAVHNLCQQPKGGRGDWTMLKITYKGGEGGKVNADNAVKGGGGWSG